MLVESESLYIKISSLGGLFTSVKRASNCVAGLGTVINELKLRPRERQNAGTREHRNATTPERGNPKTQKPQKGRHMKHKNNETLTRDQNAKRQNAKRRTANRKRLMWEF